MPTDLHPEHQKFHDHLDECERCRERPFDLCTKGTVLFHAATHAVMGTMPKMTTPFEADFKAGVDWAQQYQGKPWDPFADDCVCGHSKADHTRAHSGHVGRCHGTKEENCACMNYRKKTVQGDLDEE